MKNYIILRFFEGLYYNSCIKKLISLKIPTFFYQDLGLLHWLPGASHYQATSVLRKYFIASIIIANFCVIALVFMINDYNII